jgi:hypothetical protein
LNSSWVFDPKDEQVLSDNGGVEEEQKLSFQSVLRDEQEKAELLVKRSEHRSQRFKTLAEEKALDEAPAIGGDQLVHQRSLVVSSKAFVPDDAVEQPTNNGNGNTGEYQGQYSGWPVFKKTTKGVVVKH